MIEKQVILIIRGQQYFVDAAPDQMELMTEGVMTIADDGEIWLEYQETELTGMAGTTTRFAVKDDAVVLTRTGLVNSQMIFQRGKRHSSVYETPWGAMLVDIATSVLNCRLHSRGGILVVKYSISVDHELMGENELKIQIRERTR